MRALITGCAGFIGSHLTESLLADGVEVIGVDCFNDNYGRSEKLRNLRCFADWEAFEFVPIDLARGDLDDLVAECDVVYHLAAQPGVRPSWGQRFESYVRNNVLATQHLLEAASRHPVERFVYASSSSIYGQAERFPTPEDAVPRPLSPYGLTKLSGEHLCQLYHANVGGPDRRPALLLGLRAAPAPGHGVQHLLPGGDRGRADRGLRRRAADAGLHLRRRHRHRDAGRRGLPQGGGGDLQHRRRLAGQPGKDDRAARGDRRDKARGAHMAHRSAATCATPGPTPRRRGPSSGSRRRPGSSEGLGAEFEWMASSLGAVRA